ncbi:MULTISPECIES: helix-turn-helix domain-containing protein [unclassified Paenibacillus]|uniref:helix-turn-helix domain-containing protein n=1 Tax=unclassified Paenibacillus TaxID=185978 RepID=UPI0024074658|nr:MULTISPECIES: helix-turn-helix domain-containing protein [unclassified Paenibacillus]
MEHTLTFLHTHYRDNLQIGGLARDAHISRWQYGNLFKSLTGRTPIEYLTALRITLSRQLLANGPDVRLREIAGRVGFFENIRQGALLEKRTVCIRCVSSI